MLAVYASQHGLPFALSPAMPVVEIARATQDSLPAGGQPLPGGVGYPPGPVESFTSGHDDSILPGFAWRNIHLIVDSTGLSIVGEGEWAAAKQGGKGQRGWKKLHLGVDGSGAIIAQVLTDGNVDDARTGLAFIEAVEGDIASVTADAAYDTIAIYEAAHDQARVIDADPLTDGAVRRLTLCCYLPTEWCRTCMRHLSAGSCQQGARHRIARVLRPARVIQGPRRKGR